MTLNPKSLLEVLLILNIDKQMIENVCEGGALNETEECMNPSERRSSERDPVARGTRS